MPFQSRAQWRQCFAMNDPRWDCRKWADETPGGRGRRYRRLQDRARKKEMRVTAKEGITPIRGNLGRAPNGKFIRIGGTPDAPIDLATGKPITLTRRPDSSFQSGKKPGEGAKPAAKPKGRKGGGKGKQPAAAKPTPEQRAVQESQQRQQTLAALNLPDDAVGALEDLRAGKPVDDDGGLVKLGLAEQAADGSYRLTAAGRSLYESAGRGDVGAARDALSRAADSASARQQRQDAVAARRDAAAAKKLAAEKPKKGGGGGGGAAKPSEEEKRAAAEAKQREREAEQAKQREQAARDAARQVGLADGDLDDLRQAADAGGADNQALRDLGLIDNNGDATDAGRQALSALERGDVRGYRAAAQNARERQQRETERQSAAQRREQKRQTREAERTRREAEREAERTQREAERTAAQQRRDALQQRRLGRLAERARRGERLTQSQRDQLTDADLAVEDADGWRLKAARYAHIDFRPPDGAREAARRALEVRASKPPSQRGMTAVGLARARDLSNGVTISPSTVRRMLRYFTRHQGDKKGQTWDEQGPGWQAWQGWGGDAGWAWARKVVRQMNAADRVTTKADAPSHQHYGMLTVFKDARGGWRWISRTTTAYQDRDREILSLAGLEANAARMTATKQHGPLRYWHIGRPTPHDPTRPWGIGADLGTCDHSTVIGRTLVESGTFADAATAERIARHAQDFEISPGFSHSPLEPGQDRIFEAFLIFERSLIPRHRGGRASNLFTGLVTTKESRMDEQELMRRLAAFQAEIGASDESMARLKSDLLTTEKTARQQRIAYKDAASDGIAAIEAEIAALQARVATLKAAPPVVAPAAEQPADSTQEKADLPMGEDETSPADAMEDAEENMLTAAEIDAIATACVAKLMAALDSVSQRRAAMDEEMKAMGYTRVKEAVDAAVTPLQQGLVTVGKGAAAKLGEHEQTLATLKEQSAALETRIKELEGQQPAGPPAAAHVASQSPESAADFATWFKSAAQGTPAGAAASASQGGITDDFFGFATGNGIKPKASDRT